MRYVRAVGRCNDTLGMHERSIGCVQRDFRLFFIITNERGREMNGEEE